MENTKTETTTVIEINDSEKSVTSAENPSCDIQEHSPNENKVSSEVSSSVNVPKSDNIELKKCLEPVKKENSDQGNNNQPAKKTTTSNCNKRKLDNPHDGDSIEEKKSYQMRKNIRGILDENNIDTTTKTAQREEYERLARVQELKKSLKSKGYFGPIENVNIKADLHSVHGADTPRYLIQNKSYIYQNKHFQRSIDGNKVLSSQWHATRFHTGAVKQTDEVVTIDSSSEDDCIILSDSDDCLEDEIEADDRHNSGSHIRDMLNIPNEQGRVLVNVGHVENEPDIFMAPQIAKIIKPHQIGGVRFLFDNIIESTNRFSSSSGFGCILAHSMGLGKTLQVICFCDIFLRHTNSKSILCVMPINTIQNWVNEFNMWVPQISFNEEEVRPREFNVFALNDQHKTLTSRAKVIRQWQTEGGVLLIGYEMFRVLGLKVAKKKEGKKHTESASHKQMLENMYMALVRPGPDLVICDEGHRIKNAHAGISLALKQIRTRRRIVLTGYPLQNNLLEYWCMVDFVRPNYLGSKAEFCNMFERPIQNGQCIDSTPQDIKLMRYRAHVLHSLLVGFVQRRSDSVLQSSLPQKLEYVLQFKMTKFQRSLYEAFMNEVVRKKKVPNPLKAFAVCCKIWNHPDVLYNFLKKREFEFDLEIDEPDNQETNSKLNTNNLNPKKAGDISTSLPTTYKTPPTTKDKNIRNDLLYGNSSEHPLFYPNSTITSVNESKNCFWGEGGNSVGAQPLTPDYVGVMPKTTTKPNDVDNSQCSTQIVDLDTKEVQFVTSTVNEDLDMYPLSLTNNSGAKNLEAETKGIKIDKLENKTTESIPYDWALNLFKNYEPGMANNSPKMEIFLHIVNSSVKMGDRVLVFSQSLLTLNLIESFLQKSQVPETQTNWKKNSSYCRLDGSTSAIEREKLVNEFNKSEQFKVFLISTRAGSLGINLTGANRVVIFDASWNPCHDTQAVHRIYRFGQKKSCFVYRLIMDNCLEKNIYDRQVKKQGMSDRVVDECNPDAHLSIRELTNLCYDKVEEKKVSVVFTKPIESYTDTVMREIIANYKDVFTKEPFCHESLLVDRKDKKLSQTEKKLAKRAYEMEKKAATRPQILLPANLVPNKINQTYPQPMRKIVKEPFKNTAIKLTRWIPAEVWQRQGMSSQEMKLPIDVSIPTNANDASSIVVKAGEKVMVLKSPKGVYMQLQSGKIIAIKTTADAVQEKITRGKKLETFEDKRILNLEGIKDVRCNLRLERPVAEDDKDDVIIIEDKDTDETAESVINLKEPSPPDPNRKIENVQPRGDQPDVVPFPSTILKNTQNPKELEQRTKFCQPTKPEPPPLMNYLDNQCDQFLDNSMNNLNTYTNQHVQSSNTASTATPSAPSNGWENTSPEMYKQSLKISNIPAPYPSTAVFSTYEKNERTPQPLNNPPSTNVEQFQSTYMHPNNQTSADAYHHNPDLSANYYNNSMLPTPTENVGSLNTYQYNKKENCYSENLYENSNNSHANYHHPQMSKYSYGSYYQPQYLPNYAKGYEECAYPATANSQFYLRRPNTYSPNTSDGVDLGLNYTEAQGWMNKHLSN